MKIAICEDEKIYRDVIAKMILDFFQGTAYGDAEIFYFCDGTELLKSTERFDLILMDLKMENSDGMDVSEKVKSSDPDTEIIFVTSDKERTAQGYRVRAFDYIVKDCLEEALLSALDRFVKTLEKRKTAVALQDGEVRVIEIDRILFVESFGRGTRIVITETENTEELYSPWAIGRISVLLPADRFIEVFKSVFVRTDGIKRIGRDTITMDGEWQLPLSRRKRRGVMSAVLDRNRDI